MTIALFALSVAADAQVSLPADPQRGGGAAVQDRLAAEPSPDTVLLRNAMVTLTRADYDLELTRLPPDKRGGFGADPERVNQLLSRMLVTKTMAAEARKAGVDRLPEPQRRIAAEAERILASVYMDQIGAEAAKEFEARPGIEVAARERWLAAADKYKVGERVSVTHILFDLQKHGKDEALKLAQEARAKILAGTDMNTLAREISEDPSATRNSGRIDDFTSDQADPAFARASFALKDPGDLSEPVLSRHGYHVIRLDGRRPAGQRPFVEVKDEIVADMRAQFVDMRRGERIAAVRDDPNVIVNGPAVEALVVRVNQETIRQAVDRASAVNPPMSPVLQPRPAAK